MGFIVAHVAPEERDASLPAAALLDRVIPPAVLTEVVARHRPPGSRRRKLPGPLVLLLVVALFLHPGADLATVLALLLLPQRIRGQVPPPAGKGAISRARYRWGPRPLAALMRRVCRPLADPEMPGATLCGLRAVAFDASYEDVADTPANEAAFGRRRNQHGPSAYPQLMGMYLVECGTHAILDACPWPCRTSEHRAAPRLLRSVVPGMLVLWDCGLHSYPLAAAVRARDAHFLGRVPANQTFAPLQALPDGSQLALWYRDAPSRRSPGGPSLLVRLVTYHLDGVPAPARLVTSLLDWAAAPALDLVCGYHERWEIELAFDEMGPHQRLLDRPLRSQKPPGVIQEFYGLVLAHYAVRAALTRAATEGHLDPDRLSFSRAARLLPASLLLGDLLAAPEQDALRAELGALLRQAVLPARRSRRAPRLRKRPTRNPRLRTQATPYHITRLPPFRDRVTIHAPPPAP